MSGDRHARMSEIFIEACDLDADQRPPFLDAACGDDEVLRREVDDLLAQDSRAAAVDTPLLDVPSALEDVEEPLPERIGPFEIIGLLGTGGMGRVYRARQEHPDREVAVKVIRSGLMRPELQRRLRHEARILGRLQHVGIAQVLEAGTLDDGRPYLAMELIEGERIDTYARVARLTHQDRIRLVIKVCEAVQHAHDNGIVHRDLKPGNILVNETGQPKVLDFGVARLAEGEDRMTTIETRVGQVLGTLPYMSPEQISGVQEAVDRRTDVYALGALLYEMLAGHPPYDLNRKSIVEAARLIEETEPSRLSSIDSAYRGDIETMVHKALEKDRDRRYDSAAELSADLGRYLDHQPIVARPPSLAYSAWLFTRRHRALVVATGLVVAALLASTVVSTAFAIEARRAGAREARERTSAEHVVAEMREMLIAGSPHRMGEEVTVAEMLQAAISRLDNQPVEPFVEASMRTAIGESLMASRRDPEGEVQARRAVELFRSLGRKGTDYASALNLLGLTIAHQGRDEEAIPFLREAAEQPGQDDEQQTSVLQNLAGALLRVGHHEEALPLIQQELDWRLEHGEMVMAIASMRQMGRAQLALNQFDDAADSFQNALATTEEVLPPSHPMLPSTLGELATARLGQGRFDEAGAAFERAWELVRANRTPGSGDWIVAIRKLSEHLLAHGQEERAREVLADAWNIVNEPERENDRRAIEARKMFRHVFAEWLPLGTS